jgi:glycosyltransferase involved in cell wall biosynthesis
VIELDFHGKGCFYGSVSFRRILSKIKKSDAILCGVDEHSLVLGLLIGRIKGGRVFAMIEDPPFTTRYERIKGMRGNIEKSFRIRLLRNLLNRCAGLFCFIEKDILTELNLQSVPLYQMMNGASSVALDWVMKNGSSGNSTAGFTVGLVGAISHAQGIGSLLEIVSLARRKNGNICLRLIGPMETSYTETFQRRIKELKLGSCTEITGWLPYPLMLAQLQECSVGVYCNPSTAWYRAAQPLKICEYLALGKPTVSWDYPGARRLLRDGLLGKLVPVGNKESFADALVSLNDPLLYGGYQKAFLTTVKNGWGSQYWFRKVLQIIEKSCTK